MVSVDHPSVPVTAKYVRASGDLGGAIISPIPGQPTSCELFRVNNLDPKLGDAIPESATVQINQMQAGMLSEVFFRFQKVAKRKPMKGVLWKGPLLNASGYIKGDLVVDDIEEADNEDVLEEEEHLTPMDHFSKALLDAEPGVLVAGLTVGFAVSYSLLQIRRKLMKS